MVATVIRKQCDYTGLSTQDTDYCLSSEESSLTEELDSTELTEDLANVIGTIQNIQSDGYVCRCDSDECNTATARIPNLFLMIFTILMNNLFIFLLF